MPKAQRGRKCQATQRVKRAFRGQAETAGIELALGTTHGRRSQKHLRALVRAITLAQGNLDLRRAQDFVRLGLGRFRVVVARCHEI